MKRSNKTPTADAPAFQARFLIVDDDKVVTTLFRAHLKTHFAAAHIDIENEPRIQPGYDVYFIDNDFNGQRVASDLVDSIRQVEPQALIVSLSTTLDLQSLRHIVNLGCNAVYSKQAPAQSNDARSVISNYLKIIKRQRTAQSKRNTFSNTVTSLFDLLGEWNKRLSTDLGQSAGANK